MRVATLTTYKQATYQLNRLTTELAQANEQVNTGLAISTASDDPGGMAQVLSMSSTLSVLTQTQVNIEQGRNVLTNAETALDSMADVLTELNLLASHLANASANTGDRADAAKSMQNYLDQLLDLANTKGYGGYVFAGDENQVAPFSYDDADSPRDVRYLGSADALMIKTGDDTVMSLGLCGSDLFYEDKINVDASNNALVFRENPGTATEDILTIDVTVPSGRYTREELASALETAMNQASVEQGYAVAYEVTYNQDSNTFSIGTDGSYDGEMTTTLLAQQEDTPRISNLDVSGDGEYDDVEIDIIYEDSLTEFTPEPEGTSPLTLTYSEADSAWKVENDPGYGMGKTIQATGSILEIDVDDDGITDIAIDLGDAPEDGTMVSFDIVRGWENNSILPDLGFDSDTVTIKQVTSNTAVADSFTVVAGKNNTIDFTEVPVKGGTTSTQLTAVIEPGTYSDPPSYARAVEKALESASAQYGNRVNYEVAYNPDNQTFTIKEDTDTGRQLSSFTLLFSSGTNSDSSAAEDLGFTLGNVSSAPQEGEEATWGIFDTVLDLEHALASDDVDALQRAMIRLQNHYESISSAKSSVGRIYDSLTHTFTLASAKETTLTIQRHDVQNADSVASIMRLNATQTTYQAALSSTAKIMNMSLADHL